MSFKVSLSFYYGFLISFATGTGGPLGIILSKWFTNEEEKKGAVMAGGSIGSLFFIHL